jgi:hypothetical protein
MNPMVLTNISKLEESISDMVFRNECHIKISKSKREKALSMAVDIYIDSHTANLYENHNAEPSIKHYGYCQLVFQDAFSQIFPITQFRQRFYHEFQWEGIRQWQEWVSFYQNLDMNATSLRQGKLIQSTLGIAEENQITWDMSPILFPSFAPSSKWIELPLREVHIKCAQGTQFTVSYSQWQPIPFQEKYYGLYNYDGKSNQIDGEKDNGVPPQSIPKSNPKSNPWEGNPLPDSSGQIIEKGFSPVDTANWEPSTDIPATPTTEGYYMECRGIICSTIQEQHPVSPIRYMGYMRWYGCVQASSIDVYSIVPLPFNCNGTPLENYNFRINGTSIDTNWYVIGGSSINGVIKFGLLPEGVSVSEL